MRTRDRNHTDDRGIDRQQPDAVRAGDTDREAAAELLRTHHAAGRLTDDEFQQRLEESMAARTFGDLRALVADMPDHRPPAPPMPPHGWPRPWRRGWHGFGFLPIAVVLMLLWSTMARHAGWHHGYHAHHAAWFPWPLVLFAVVALAALRRRARYARYARRMHWV